MLLRSAIRAKEDHPLWGRKLLAPLGKEKSTGNCRLDHRGGDATLHSSSLAE
jgi:hypothetical protein